MDVVKEYAARRQRIGAELLDRRECQALALHIDDEHRKAVGAALDVLRLGRSRDNEHLLRGIDGGNPDLAAIEPPAVAVARGESLYFKTVRAGIGLRQRHTKIDFAGRQFG